MWRLCHKLFIQKKRYRTLNPYKIWLDTDYVRITLVLRYIAFDILALSGNMGTNFTQNDKSLRIGQV